MATWDRRRVFITYRNLLTEELERGNWTATISGRVVNTLDDGTKQVFRAGPVRTGPLNTDSTPSLSVELPVVDDPDNTDGAGAITLTIQFDGAGMEEFVLTPLLSWPEEGTDLAPVTPNTVRG